jgi:hypothetical protein
MCMDNAEGGESHADGLLAAELEDLAHHVRRVFHLIALAPDRQRCIVLDASPFGEASEDIRVDGVAWLLASAACLRSPGRGGATGMTSSLQPFPLTRRSA